MSARFHTPSFGDEVFDFEDAPTSTPTSSFIAGKNDSAFLTHQQTPPSAKRMLSSQNTSDEYYTANEDSFNVTNKSMSNSVIQQNITPNNVLPSRQTGAAAATSIKAPTTMAARKQMLPVDQTEPAKPLSAYALFFRDTVSAIKQQNPACSFQELSKIVASMWDALDPADKGVYNKRNELARVEYLKQMKAYQQQQQQKQEQEQFNANAVNETLPTDTNGQQQTATQQVTQPLASNINVQQNTQQVNNTSTSIDTAAAPTSEGTTNGSSDDQTCLSNEAAGAVQKCLRENCNKRAIISPDWEDEYCSNECVVIHCRNVFNDWVQSNLEARQQEQQEANKS